MKRHARTLIAIPFLAFSAALAAQVAGQSEKIKAIPDFDKRELPQDEIPMTKTQAIGAQIQARQQIHFAQGSVAQGQLAQLLYQAPSYYPCGYLYTAELRPISGDPDLYLHERVSGTWRQIKKSVNGSGVLDSFTFTCNDITPSATNVDLDAKGYSPGISTYEFALYKEPTAGGSVKFMDFPLHNGSTPYTATINAVVDHSMTTGPNCADYVIVSYTNERGDDQYGLSSFSTPAVGCPGGDPLQGYRNASNTPFSIHGRYNATSGNEYGRYLFYDGHTGYDYPASNGTAVYPVAPGTAYLYSDGIRVVHTNGYISYYLHLSTKDIYDGQSVNTNTRIGGVGSGHLHLTIMKGTQRADPYGWTGPSGQDPLRVDGGDNVCLWNACP